MPRILVVLAAASLLLTALSGLDGDPALAGAAAACVGRHSLELPRHDELGRRFWRPSGSEAQLPPIRTGARSWHPQAAGAPTASR